jgi:hypothetical protein
MSREVDIGIKVGDTTIGGKYVTQFRQPLILKPCEHFVDKEKSRIRGEIWYIMSHGKEDGSSETTKRCEKLRGWKNDSS